MGKCKPSDVAIHDSLTLLCSKCRTRDMGGNATTHQFTRSILDKLETM